MIKVKRLCKKVFLAVCAFLLAQILIITSAFCVTLLRTNGIPKAIAISSNTIICNNKTYKLCNEGERIYDKWVLNTSPDFLDKICSINFFDDFLHPIVLFYGANNETDVNNDVIFSSSPYAFEYYCSDSIVFPNIETQLPDKITLCPSIGYNFNKKEITDADKIAEIINSILSGNNASNIFLEFSMSLVPKKIQLLFVIGMDFRLVLFFLSKLQM